MFRDKFVIDGDYGKLYVYRKNNGYDEAVPYGEDISEEFLLDMFEKYINAYNQEYIFNNEPEQNNCLRNCILRNNPLLIERAFIFCCDKNDLKEIKNIYYSFIYNGNCNINGESKKIFQNIEQRKLLIDICKNCKKEIVIFVVSKNILSNINYKNLFSIILEDCNIYFVLYLLEIIYLCNPNALISEPTIDYYFDGSKISERKSFETIDIFETCLNKAFNRLNFEVIRHLQKYRPFQFGCHFKSSAEQDEKKYNYYKINFIEEYDDFIQENDAIFDWKSFRKYISSRKNINNFDIDFELIKKRMDYVPEGCEMSFREELMRNRFHPKYIDKWIDWGHCEPEDFE
jgi:hypothetical protein